MKFPNGFLVMLLFIIPCMSVAVPCVPQTDQLQQTLCVEDDVGCVKATSVSVEKSAERGEHYTTSELNTENLLYVPSTIETFIEDRYCQGIDATLETNPINESPLIRYPLKYPLSWAYGYR